MLRQALIAAVAALLCGGWSGDTRAADAAKPGANAIASPAAKGGEVGKMPAYRYPPEPVSAANAAHWQWMRAFYDREVSQPASANETLAEVQRRAARVKPTPEKLAYLDMELITFPHFGMSTVSGHQQGTEKRTPAVSIPRGSMPGSGCVFIGRSGPR